jgi:hypothetical protein
MGMKAVAMWRWSCSTFRTVVVSLLMLATLLVYATRSQAGPAPHDRSIAPHEHVVVTTLDEAAADKAVAYLDHEEAPCAGAGHLHDGTCCSVAQCATMHGGLPADIIEVFVPRLDTSTHLPAPAMPEGISSDPALRPPCLII